MDYRNAKQEMALLIPTIPTAHQTKLDAIRDEAMAVRYADRSATLSGLAAWVGSFFSVLRDLPQRHRVQSELRMLSDRELADIGLIRSDVSHIYESDFVAHRKGAPAYAAQRLLA